MEASESGAGDLVGRVLSERYRIEALLGEGGIGRVYVARHLTLGRQVALKVLLGRYENVDVLKQRFAREAEALAALSHPNIVTVTDYGVDGELPYIVMELLEGRDLSEVLDEPEPLPPKRVFDIVRQALRALAYAHDRGLVHRDLKPHNIFVRDLGHGQEHVHVLDFGLARFIDGAAQRGPKLTRQGALIGTPAYMAPEQASGEVVDARADVYAMGCVLFEALTGRRPFPMSDPGQLLRAHLLTPPPSLSQVDTGLRCSAALETLVARSLEKSPDKRFQSATEMLDALDALSASDAERIGPRPAMDEPVSGVAPTLAPGRAEIPTRGATPSAKREEVTAPSVSLPKNRAPLFAALGCALVAGVVVAGVLGFTFFTGGDDDEVAVSPPPPPPAPAGDAPAPPPAVEPAPAALEPPLEGADLPDAIREAIALRERRAYSRAERVLDAYALANRDDVRAQMRYQLLKGHLEADQRHLTDAITRYELAYQEDRSVVADEELPHRLMEVACVSDRRVAARGAALIERGYGASAAPGLRQAADASERDRGFPCTRSENLAQLASRLEASGATP